MPLVTSAPPLSMLLALLAPVVAPGPASVELEVYQGDHQWASALSLPQAIPVNFRWKWTGSGAPQKAEWQVYSRGRPPAVVNIRTAALASHGELPHPLPSENQSRRFTLAMRDIPLNVHHFYVRVRATWPGGAMAASEWVRVSLRVPYQGPQIPEGLGPITIDLDDLDR